MSDLISRGKNGQITEADLVELKSGWPDIEEHPRCARQIAGCVNASKGSDFMFLIGIQEKPRFEVLGVPDVRDLNDWWTKIKHCFAGAAPTFTTHVVTHEDKSVVALVFGSALAPFMVKNQWHRAQGQKGDIAAEVPWREGNGARTATRDELLGMLVSIELTPTTELLDCMLSEGGTGDNHQAVLTLRAYIEPQSSRRVSIALHRCEVYALAVDNIVIPLTTERLFAGCNELVGERFRARSRTIKESATELLVKGPGTIMLQARSSGSLAPYKGSHIDVSVRMPIAHAAVPISLSLRVDPGPSPNGLPFWRWTR